MNTRWICQDIHSWEDCGIILTHSNAPDSRGALTCWWPINQVHLIISICLLLALSIPMKAVWVYLPFHSQSLVKTVFFPWLIFGRYLWRVMLAHFITGTLQTHTSNVSQADVAIFAYLESVQTRDAKKHFFPNEKNSSSLETGTTNAAKALHIITRRMFGI